MKMQITLLLIVLISSALAFTLDPGSFATESVSTSSVSGFPYKIGARFGSDRANTLINFINSASTLYRDDYKQNLFYIHSSMTAAYADAGVFSLIIQGNSTNSRTSTFIYGYDNMASFSAGINMINPTWSYYAYFKDRE
jgi:hypothetical protein